jgi:glucosamine kinase
LNNSQALINFYANAPAREFAKLAPLVFQFADRLDEFALNLINTNVVYIKSIFGKLESHNASRISLIGGLAKSYIPYLKETLSKHQSQKLSKPLFSPERGAVLLARQLFESRASKNF